MDAKLYNAFACSLFHLSTLLDCRYTLVGVQSHFCRLRFLYFIIDSCLVVFNPTVLDLVYIWVMNLMRWSKIGMKTICCFRFQKKGHFIFNFVAKTIKIISMPLRKHSWSGLIQDRKLLESHHQFLSLPFNLGKLETLLWVPIVHLSQFSLHRCVLSYWGPTFLRSAL